MLATDLNPNQFLPSGLCEDPAGECSTLIRRMSQRDAGALIELHSRWAPVLLGIASRMLHGRNGATEAVEETFVHLWQEAREFPSHNMAPLVWAYTTLRDRCLSRIRQRPIRETSTPAAISPPERPDGPRGLSADDRRRVRAALDLLTPEELHSLEQAVFLSYSPAHAGETHPVAIKSQLRQSLGKVRTQLSRYEL